MLRKSLHEPIPDYMKWLTLMGARFIEGNTGEGSDEETTPNEETTPPPPAPDKAKGLEAASNEELLAEITRLRQENAKDRTSAKEKAAQDAQDELVQKLAGALGIGDGDNSSTPSVEDLTAQLQASQDAQRQQAVEFAAWKHADSLGVDAKALLNQYSFRQAVNELDPASDSFKSDLKSAIEEEKKSSPFIAKTPSRSGSQLQQHKGPDGEGGGSKSPEELAASISDNNPY